MGKERIVVIRGAGDLATGIAHALFRGGFLVVMLEVAQPTMVRRTVSFGQAVYQQQIEVDGVLAQLAKDGTEARELLEKGVIPILVDPKGASIPLLTPAFLIDAIMAKENKGTSITDAPVVIGVGPGFTAGVDVHLVVETQRGPNLGALYTQGTAAADTGIPGEVLGYTTQRVIRSPATGRFYGEARIGEQLVSGQRVGVIKDNEKDEPIPVTVQISGVLRGLISDGILVNKGLKIGDVDPRCDQSLCQQISDKSKFIGAQILKYCLTKKNKDS